mmetsp:Transcript_7325/g.16638  ORF Transcript_7325/g.16638 Transcript_7325/m.16638 type:complete len:315 (-) Transcript_7325:114-1058(-)|eukprot:CAMPEP_0197926872 /NCGR_PEP_ID=MMETSP1439-20131203/99825_1 /TAXON_ID=66791 /ORGANISM="Gonyaulax spinifera, Strain CCMP409" /LENGTH=314 /DNA_ID=CAMNT_0043549423 /DNA_START=51 /DNA_END=995 /DNA_ORIENTATION=-
MKVETIFSEAGVKIVASPFLVGEELEELAVATSQDWVRSLPAERLAGQPDPVSLEILNGGKYYFVSRAYEKATGKPCKVATLRAKRGHASAETYGGPAHLDKDIPPGTELWRATGSDWCVRIWDVEPLPAGPVLVGDTIGTGTTLAGVLGWVASKMEAAKAVHDIFVFTIAGAASWATDGGVLKKLEPVDEVLRRHGRELHVTFANGRFALQQNGTDMSPCPSMGAQLNEQARKELEAKIGADFLRHMKCAIWDWGDRFRKPLEHLEDVEKHFKEQAACPAYITDGITERLKSLRSVAEAVEPPAKKAKAADPA